MVIFNHSYHLIYEKGFYSYLYDEVGSIRFILDFVISNICKSGVPIFFMISGVTLVSKNESSLDTLKRIPKVLLDLLICSYIYFIIDSVKLGERISIGEIAINILNYCYPHLWYLYAYICFLITVPILRKFAGSFDRVSALYFVTVSILSFGVASVTPYTWKYPSWTTVNIFVYPLIGYIIDKFIEIHKVTRKHIVWTWGVVVISLIIDIVLESALLRKSPGNTSEQFMQNFCIINCIALFITVKKIFNIFHFSKRINVYITNVSKCIFGIYLFHIIMVKLPYVSDLFIRIENIFTNQLGVLIVCVLIFTITWFFIYLLRKIPQIRKYL